MFSDIGPARGAPEPRNTGGDRLITGVAMPGSAVSSSLNSGARIGLLRGRGRSGAGASARERWSTDPVASSGTESNPPPPAQVLGPREVDYSTSWKRTRAQDARTSCRRAVACGGEGLAGRRRWWRCRARRNDRSSLAGASQHLINVLRPYMQQELGESPRARRVLDVSRSRRSRDPPRQERARPRAHQRGHGSSPTTWRAAASGTETSGPHPADAARFLEVRGPGRAQHPSIFGETRCARARCCA